MKIDSILAINACRYLESNSEDIVSTILTFVLETIEEQDFDYILDAEDELLGLPVSPGHAPLLRMLMHRHDLWGGITADLLYRLFGDHVKGELLEEMFANLHDYNYLQRIGNTLAGHISLDEYAVFLERLKTIPDEDKETAEKASKGFYNMAAKLPLEPLIELFQPFSDLTTIQRAILCDILYDDKSQKALETGIEMIQLGFQGAIFPVYMMLEYESNEQDYNLEHIDPSILRPLDILLQQNGEKKWIIRLIKVLCRLCPAIFQTINAKIDSGKGISRLAYLYTAGYKRKKEFIRHFTEMLEQGKLTEDIVEAFDEIDLHQYGDFLIEKLIWHMDFPLLTAFLSANTFQCRHIYAIPVLLSIRLINWATTEEINFDSWDMLVIGNFISNHMDKSLEKDLIDYFHTAPTPQKRFLAYYAFKEASGLRLEMFTQYDINFLVEDLRHKQYTEEVFNNGTLLSNIATEAFVEERLLPLLSEDNEILQGNLRLVLHQIGRNLGRRYQKR